MRQALSCLLLAAIVFAVGTSVVWASCPQLAGTHRCQDQLIDETVTISQTDTSPVVYSIKGSSLTADGKKHAAPPEFEYFDEGSYRLTCVSEVQLKLEFSGTQDMGLTQIKGLQLLEQNGDSIQIESNITTTSLGLPVIDNRLIKCVRVN